MNIDPAVTFLALFLCTGFYALVCYTAWSICRMGDDD